MKKGFTLIELIATIIIIGLLATITTPIIITTINNSKQSAFKESVQKVIDAIELDYSENARSGQITYKYDANSILCYKCNNTSDVKLDFTGKIENAEGNITYNDGQINGHVSSYTYYANINNGTITVTSKQAEAATNLISNGYGTENSATNFTNLNWDNQNKNFYTTTSARTIITSNEYIPVDASKKYIESITVKSSNQTATYFIGLAMYDIDKNLIDYFNVSNIGNSVTTLAKDLKKGDTLVYLTNTSGFNKSVTQYYQKGLIFWNYKDSKGTLYPKLTYSRNVWLGLYETTNINNTNNTITLNSPWANNTMTAGTYVSQSNAGGTYNYGILVNQTTPSSYTTYTNQLTGYSTANSPADNQFRQGTKYVKLLIINNYNQVSNVTLSIKDISLKVIS